MEEIQTNHVHFQFRKRNPCKNKIKYKAVKKEYYTNKLRINYSRVLSGTT